MSFGLAPSTPNPPADRHAALKKGNDYYVFDFPGGINSGALGINDSGEIVGFYSPAGKPSEQLLYSGKE